MKNQPTPGPNDTCHLPYCGRPASKPVYTHIGSEWRHAGWLCAEHSPTADTPSAIFDPKTPDILFEYRPRQMLSKAQIDRLREQFEDSYDPQASASLVAEDIIKALLAHIEALHHELNEMGTLIALSYLETGSLPPDHWPLEHARITASCIDNILQRVFATLNTKDAGR